MDEKDSKVVTQALGVVNEWDLDGWNDMRINLVNVCIIRKAQAEDLMGKEGEKRS